MNAKIPFLGSTPERATMSADKAELLRQYYAVVESSFATLHRLGYASDPEAILAAMGISRGMQQQAAAQAEATRSETPAAAPAPEQSTNGIDLAAVSAQAQAAARSKDDYELIT